MLFFNIQTKKDLQKIEILYEKYEKLLLSVAYNILHNNHLAEDAVHDTFIKIIQNLQKFHFDNEFKTKGLISIICRNISYDYYRKTYFKKEINVSESIQENDYSIDNNPLEIIINKETMQAYLDKIKQLKPVYRDVLYLKYYYELDYNEISIILNVSQDTLRKRVERAKKEIFKKDGEKNEC